MSTLDHEDITGLELTTIVVFQNSAVESNETKRSDLAVLYQHTPPIFLTFQTEGLANPCNPATWKLKVEEGVG